MVLEEFNDALRFRQKVHGERPSFERCRDNRRSVTVAHKYRSRVCVDRDL